jgi:hypothetical protein
MRYLLALILCVLATAALAQLDIKIYEFGVTAHGFHGLPVKRQAVTFRAESEAIRIFEQLIGSQGLSVKIEIRASGDVSNAAAFVDSSGARVIAYNVLFMEEVKQKTGRYWSLISIMAHEVGHHLNFHTYTPGVPAPAQSRKDELEADYFSGHALARLGASLDDALAAMRQIAPLEDSSTHPGRDSRLQAIALGWKAASQQPASTDRTSTVEEPAATPGTSRIVVTSGTLGLNCGARRGNVTAKVAEICNGRDVCSLAGYRVNIPDPAYLCSKSFSAEWQCTGKSGTKKGSVPAIRDETNVLTLSCR